MLGVRTGIGVGGVFKHGALSNQQLRQKLLFYGVYSEIANGKMPNKFGTDWITVAGIAGSETYQLPNTAEYKAADTDYIWFQIAGTQRTSTTAELIGYDFARTLVFYDNVAPYAIKAIAILKVGETISNYLRDIFNLSMWWDNTLSYFGNIKGNRGSWQSIWVAELIYTKLLSHFDGNNTDTAYSDLVAGAWTFVGGAALGSTVKKFGNTALNVSTQGCYVKTNASESFNVGNGDFTIECWYYPVVFSADNRNTICGQSDVTATAAQAQFFVSIPGHATDHFLDIYVYDNTATSKHATLSTTSLQVNNWYHIAVVRNGNTLRGYINGIAENTLDLTGVILQNVTSKFAVGNMGEFNTPLSARGHIDEFRFTKGLARYTANFTPSTSPFTLD